eukprot:SAG31_NODE_1359_length_8639_cov_3.889813_3_plen_242_part_00
MTWTQYGSFGAADASTDQKGPGVRVGRWHTVDSKNGSSAKSSTDSSSSTVGPGAGPVEIVAPTTSDVEPESESTETESTVNAFHVKQLFLGRKVSADIQLVVGTMGIQLFDGSGGRFIASHLYSDIQGGWEYEENIVNQPSARKKLSCGCESSATAPLTKEPFECQDHVGIFIVLATCLILTASMFPVGAIRLFVTPCAKGQRRAARANGLYERGSSKILVFYTMCQNEGQLAVQLVIDCL